MVPNISRNGRSFRGAGAYHLHDKPTTSDPRPSSALRVTFTATRNLANEDPCAALDEMWRTAEDAAHLKASSGARRQGRKSYTPVKTISLAWAPGQTPNRTEMIAAADGFLQAMGWQGHQAIYAAHNDTAHPHLHIILNRVHPDTGRALNDWQERKRAQQWALSYERRQGAVRCTARAARYEAGAAAPAAALPYPQARLIARQSSAVRNAAARETRAAFRPAWARHFRQQRARLADLGKQRRSVHRLAASLAREGNADAALDILDRFQRHNTRTLQALAVQRAALGRAQYAALRTRVRRFPSAGPQPAAQAPPVRSPLAANDNAARNRIARRRAMTRSGWRMRALFPSSRRPPTHSSLLLRASHRAERQLLLAIQAAAAATLRRHTGAARQASSLARSEIALAFASRWADIRRMPTALRAAAILALQAEQAAALSARLRHHAMRLRAHWRSVRQTLTGQHTAARRALADRHNQARMAARAAIKASRPGSAPKPAARGGDVPLPASSPRYHRSP
jgi:hypothetical protein